MNESHIEAGEQLLGGRNTQFLHILALVSTQFGINYNDAQLASFAVSTDDIASLNTDRQQLIADIEYKEYFSHIKLFSMSEEKRTQQP